ncbi:LANO_0F04676g1_1 [Lachancea nothofagi CBS 11611]|uniref:LANO_0F04676g1_1 n=1 Tax=Lachancea nothofagi CBS 11611 TaxID=1266666 RepID=A0A1G4K7P4_9SACH|nr:LANO_0F04676g1_1 [Lachancea nothofagi CBS 11611]
MTNVPSIAMDKTDISVKLSQELVKDQNSRTMQQVAVQQDNVKNERDTQSSRENGSTKPVLKASSDGGSRDSQDLTDTDLQSGDSRQSKLAKEEAKRNREQQKEEQRLQKELKKEQERRERDLKREHEKQEKELKRQEEKKRKEDEKKVRERKKEEDKRNRELKREHEKIEREQRKEEERQRKKLEEKIKREDEKKQKEEIADRSQTKIGTFFKKSNSMKNVVSTKTDFEKSFLPFYVKDGTVMGESFSRSPEQLQITKKAIDVQLTLKSTPEESLHWLRSQQVRRGYPVTKTAVELVQLMTSKNKTNEELEERLRQIPVKYIKFYENVRPPYVGTYSQCIELPRNNPFATEGTGFDYEYDSDWDWVNEEEGEGGDVEDLEDGDEDDEDDDAEDGTDDEFEGFLDREDSHGPRDGKKFLGPLIPLVRLRSDLEKMDDDDRQYFQMVSVELLIPESHDPYLIDSGRGSNTNGGNKRKASELIATSTGGSGSVQSTDNGQNPSQVSPLHSKKSKSLISDSSSLLKIFAEVHESTFSLGTITEILQKQLSAHSKAAIRDTIKEHTTRPMAKAGKSRMWLVKDLNLWESLKRA